MRTAVNGGSELVIFVRRAAQSPDSGDFCWRLVGVRWTDVDGGSGETRNVGQEMVLGVVGKVVSVCHGQVGTDGHISFGAKGVSDPADSLGLERFECRPRCLWRREIDQPVGGRQHPLAVGRLGRRLSGARRGWQ